MLRGRIASFDERRGLGVFVTADGEELGFHCVDIADGSRVITVGRAASARRAVGHRGHDEAIDVAVA